MVVWGAALLASLVLLCAYVMIRAADYGSIKYFVLALGVAVSPLLIVLVLRRPLVFPFALYAALAPFDNLLKTDSSATVTRLLGIAAGSAIVLHLLLSRDTMRPPRAVAVWGLLILWMASSIYWAIEPSDALMWFSRYLQLYLLFAVVALVRVRGSDLRIVLAAVIVGAIAAAGYGDYLFYHGIDIKATRLFINVDGNRIDPNHFAASLLMPFALAFTAFLRLRVTSLMKWLWLAVTLVLASGFYTSVSRGGIVAAATIIAFLFIRTKYRWQIGVLSLPAIAIGLGGSLAARFNQAISTGGNGRLNIWSSGVAAFKHYWLFGAGVGNYPNAYDQVYLDVFHWNYPYWHSVAHDLIAQSAVELGIGGLALMLFAWWCQFRVVSDIGPPNSSIGDFAVGIQAGLAGLLVSSLFLDIMWSKYTWLAFIIAVLARNYAVRHNRLAAETLQRSSLNAQHVSAVRAT